VAFHLRQQWIEYSTSLEDHVAEERMAHQAGVQPHPPGMNSNPCPEHGASITTGIRAEQD